ncbi:MAG: YheU family protein [Proteobacteria bacterium]|nr:YheU family protein [Pseudomonadota bacterium]
MNEVEIPIDRITPDTLRGLIEEFITREGTDYGVEDVPLPDKIEQVLSQLNSGEAIITWDTEAETSNIMLKKDLRLIG